MNTFPDYVQFQKQWRSYQSRVLSELEEHLDDGHLNVVAAPGSGKTVLGLEVVRRLNRPVLILAPTLAIREQWVERFISFFLPPDKPQPEWISRDIRNPNFMTFTTYQALHSAFAGAEDPEADEAAEETREENDSEAKLSVEKSEKPDKQRAEDVIRGLKGAGIKTLVLDEAHHLRSEWWKSLSVLKESLEGVIVVSLTATPPYDVTLKEWERYKELCGPVDAEIPVPELILNGDLCPHQDYVYLNSPTEEENRRIADFRNGVKAVLEGLDRNTEFAHRLQSHRYITEPDAHLEDILEDPGFFSGLLIFLNHIQGEVPSRLIKLMGHEKKRLPHWDLEWAEILLTGVLFAHSNVFEEAEPVLKPIRQALSRLGAIERRVVSLRSTDKIRKIFLTSINKLTSIEKIVRLERDALGLGLRMVILTDFIRKADLPSGLDDEKPLHRLGVVPIFEALRRLAIPNLRLGVLSGSLVVIPRESKPKLLSYWAEKSSEPAPFRFMPMAHDSGYEIMEVGEQSRNSIVRLVTKLFQEGQITVLVGSKSLLGEGWDAPAINSLVLASFVGSYMLSNQMRGRAIRTLVDHPEKTANVWHLVCVEDGAGDAGEDYDMLTRRFKAFVGVSALEPIIENGIARLGLGHPPFDRAHIKRTNEETNRRALDRTALRQRWEESLKRGQDGIRMVDEIQAREVHLPRPFVFYNTVTALFWQGVFLAGYVFSEIMRNSPRGQSDWTFRRYMILLGVALAAAALVALPKCLKALWLFLKHGPIESSMGQIGEALLRTCFYSGFIKSPLSKLRVKAEVDGRGVVRCFLEGGTSYEKALFLDAFQEILGPIDNPRYLLRRETMFGRFFRKDYHAVPELLAQKKATAQYFERMWRKYIGTTELIYTRTLEGRKVLLQARIHSLSAAFQKRTERVSCWK